MPRCYMVKKGGAQRHEAPPPRSPTEAAVAPPCYSPAPAEPRSAEHAETGEAGGSGGGAVEVDHAGAGPEAEAVAREEVGVGVGVGVGLAQRSAADTEAAHDLLSLAQSLPPLPATAVVTVLDTAPLVPLYTYTIQPTNIYILAEEPPEPVYHAVQSVAPLQTVDYDQVNYVYAPEPESIIEIEQPSYIEPEPVYRQEIVNHRVVGQNYSLELELQIEHQSQDVSESEPQVETQPELELEPETDPEPEPEQNTSSKDKSAKYHCKECGKKYATSSNLSRHKQTHRSLDSVSAKRCGECGKAYVSMPALAMHVLTHRMGHVCGVCGKQFSRPWLLRGHLRSHTGEKPYSCASCGKAFADRSNLRAHLQTHSSDKKHECPRCGKTFALKSYLNKHQESACVRDPGADDDEDGDD